MTTTGLRMLTALTCVLAASANTTPVPDFSLEKVAGKWYMAGFATNAQWFVNHKDTMKMGIAMMVPTDIGDLDLSYATLNADGTCWRMTHLAKKTDTPGRFTFHSQVWNNDNDMRFVDVVYDSYAVVHTIKTKEGVSEVLNKLYSRSPEISADLQQKFTQFSLDTGILAENIVTFPQNGECPEDSIAPNPI
ncbi:lipocalin-like [Xiphophorus hellerii]|uniref:lipocalin-like n=1 Tax=Xiphophorus hellerii TaxID=8084 RepID=UPI0013B38273|nr:lipocalin-like [Xiphophorus hellerii]